MEFTNGGQLYELFLSCGFGFLIGVYYDVFRVIRLMIPCRPVAVFFQDLFFFVTSAAATFLFDLTLTGGQLRFYLFLGLAAGFVAYYFTLGRLVMAFSGAVIHAVALLFRWIWQAICWPFRLLGRILRRPLTFLWKKAVELGKKVAVFFKKGLQRGRALLYNQKRNKTQVSQM